MKIKLTSIFVDDPIKAFKFYTRILGFKEHLFMPEGKLAIVVSAEDENGIALLLEPRGDEFAKEYQETVFKKNLPSIVLGDENIYETFERLKSLGVHFTKKPIKTDWGIIAEFDDTCGNIIQIHQDL
jgi:predicted enzyme related to lactoylglutathione lyase